jgi:ligand-binding sensor domain-containing protein
MIKPFSTSITKALNVIYYVMLCSLLLQLLPVHGNSQALNLKFDRLGYDEGLTNNFVICSFQDSKGFLWFGTSYGLNRYDGYTFKTYLHDLKNDNTLSHNWLTDIVEDEDGNLWIATQNGLKKFSYDIYTYLMILPVSLVQVYPH